MCFYLLIVLFYMCVCVRVGLHNFFYLIQAACHLYASFDIVTIHDMMLGLGSWLDLNQTPFGTWRKICVDTVLSVCYTPNSFCSWLDVLYNDFLFQILYIFIILFAEWYCCFSCRSPKYTVSMMNVCGSESFFPDLFSN